MCYRPTRRGWRSDIRNWDSHGGGLRIMPVRSGAVLSGALGISSPFRTWVDNHNHNHSGAPFYNCVALILAELWGEGVSSPLRNGTWSIASVYILVCISDPALLQTPTRVSKKPLSASEFHRCSLVVTKLTLAYLWSEHSNFPMSLPVRLFRVASEKKKLMSWLCAVQSSHTQMQGTLKYPPFDQFVSQTKWPPTFSSTCSHTSFTSLALSLLPRAIGHSLQASCLSPSFSTMPDSNQRTQEVSEGVVAILDYWLGSWAAPGFQVRSRRHIIILTFLKPFSTRIPFVSSKSPW